MAMRLWIGALALAASVGTASGAERLRAPELRGEESLGSVQIAAGDRSQFVALGIGKSVALDLPRDIRDVLVSDPKIANAVVRSARRVFLIGVNIGETSVFFFDAEGKQIAGFDVAVKRDLNGLRAALRHTFPDADIRVEALGADGVILTGTVASPTESQQALEVATRLLSVSTTQVTNEGSRVVNALTVRGRDQVMLKVTVAEIQRDVIKQLGVDLGGSAGQGSAVINFANFNPYTAFGSALVGGNGIQGKFSNVTATLRAMERAGVIRTLAEPSLTAISGENANFVAGGEFPIPAGLSCDTTKSPPICQQTIEYKKFGVSMTFTPVVLAEGRISLKVITEVSELSQENAITLSVPGSNSTLTIPSIRVRRADTTVEIPSGGSLAMAGMIQEQTKQAINGLPGMMQLPVLGTLFRSRDYVNRQTEMVVLVTPYVVRSVARKDLSRPDDGFADTSDPSAILLARLNKIYGIAGKVDPNRTYRGTYGFILD